MTESGNAGMPDPVIPAAWFSLVSGLLSMRQNLQDLMAYEILFSLPSCRIEGTEENFFSYFCFSAEEIALNRQ